MQRSLVIQFLWIHPQLKSKNGFKKEVSLLTPAPHVLRNVRKRVLVFLRGSRVIPEAEESWQTVIRLYENELPPQANTDSRQTEAPGADNRLFTALSHSALLSLVLEGLNSNAWFHENTFPSPFSAPPDETYMHSLFLTTLNCWLFSC